MDYGKLVQKLLAAGGRESTNIQDLRQMEPSALQHLLAPYLDLGRIFTNPSELFETPEAGHGTAWPKANPDGYTFTNNALVGPELYKKMMQKK
jgi:hypothetical protein